MRVNLVGPEDARERLREVLADVGIEVFAETDRDGEATVVISPNGHEPLTPREIEVLELLAEGLSNKAIAARLGISDSTAKHHVAAVTAKLGAENRTDAVTRGVRMGLVVL